ncbi:MAG TPA: Rid family detoxifying hydrolase [Acidimicrobiales bacterium]|nr:Rid family detoxifying hydrolase [Acidimicrobiales bacterium]
MSGAGGPVGPYSPCRRVDGWVVTSGQIGIGPGVTGLVEGGTGAQLRQALANLSTVLATQGATLADVVKTTVFVADMDDLAVVNEIWVEVFGENRPARSAVGAARLPLDARVEVEAWAVLPPA